MLQIIKISLVFSLFLAFSGCTTIEHPAPVMSVEEIAVDGYDVVAYFKVQKAVKGQPGISYRYKSVNWLFSTEENRVDFEASPQKYFPAFGGFCAYELANEKLVNSDPEFWYIHNDTLFLFSKGSGFLTADSANKKEWFRKISLTLPAGQAYWSMINEPTAYEKQQQMAQDFMNGSFY